MLDKKYNHSLVEKDKYEKWLNSSCFKAGDNQKEPFCIVIPPPNITGKLHIGHAWDTTLQDIIVRYKRMDNYDTLWLPGMDHAGIATQAKIDEKLKSEGINPREIGRDEWLKQAWGWKEEYATFIREQWGKLGLSLDYSKEKFTMDEDMNKAVNKVFVDLYNKGFIYKGKKIINFDPKAMTALSNIEVIYKELSGNFYYIKYYLENSNDYLEIATTRPETIFGDTAVAINPKDEKNKHLVGQKVVLPIINKTVPIIEDDYVDMDMGSGIVKITPAHDINDFEIGNKHNLERINCMNMDGTMNAYAGIYEGLDRFECRKRFVKQLQEQNLLIKTDSIIHSVGHSERTDEIIEPFLSEQWFVKMDILADQALDNQKDKNTKVNFIPKRFEKIFSNWMEEIQDWCISRQLWWGHRIPAWYKGEEIYVGIEAPKEAGWIQDNDVLDTWFSSALWPFATLGWPHNLNNRYYPNNVLVTGYDIIFFWVSRMIFQGLEFTNTRPFKEVLIHGLIRDKEGRKMSKSLGNGVDPMEVIDKYGVDSLRFFINTSSAPGQDLRYDEDKVNASWNFINKLWNASRFVFINIEDYDKKDYRLVDLSLYDKWILTKLNDTIKTVRKHMDRYEFNIVGSTLHRFVWDDFCDWYIELAKSNIEEDTTKAVLLYTLEQIIKMLHPFMPFVTEEIYQMLPIKGDSIVISEYPKYDNKLNYQDEVTAVNKIIEIITKIRSTKQENEIGGQCFVINLLDEKEATIFNQNMEIIKKLSKVEVVDKLIDNYEKITITFPYGKIIIGYIEKKESLEKEIEKLKKEKELLTLSIDKRSQLFNDEVYLSKAPKDIIDREKEKLKAEQIRLADINKRFIELNR